MKAWMLIIIILTTLVGCQSVNKVAIKATPSLRDPSRFEYTVEFNNR